MGTKQSTVLVKNDLIAENNKMIITKLLELNEWPGMEMDHTYSKSKLKNYEIHTFEHVCTAPLGYIPEVIKAINFVNDCTRDGRLVIDIMARRPHDGYRKIKLYLASVSTVTNSK
jgi:hypothetical protein